MGDVSQQPNVNQTAQSSNNRTDQSNGGRPLPLSGEKLEQSNDAKSEQPSNEETMPSSHNRSKHSNDNGADLAKLNRVQHSRQVSGRASTHGRQHSTVQNTDVFSIGGTADLPEGSSLSQPAWQPDGQQTGSTFEEEQMLVPGIPRYPKPPLFKHPLPAGVRVEPPKLLNDYNSGVIEAIDDLGEVDESTNLESSGLTPQQKGEIRQKRYGASSMLTGSI